MTEYNKMTKEQLIKTLAEKRVALRAFAISRMGGKVKNTKEAKNNRRDIARILTAVSAQ